MKVVVTDLIRTADALGDVVTSQLEVDATGPGVAPSVSVEILGDLIQDDVEVPSLQSAGATDGVAMHRVAHPHHRVVGLRNGFDEWRQARFDVIPAHATYER